MKLIKLAAAALITLSSLSANALMIDGGNNYTIPNLNLFKANNSITALEYNIGGNVKSDFNGEISLKFTYLGAEAAKYNTFTVGANSLGNEFSSFGDSFVHTFNLMDGDLFDFAFSTTVDTSPYSNVVANGANVENIFKPSFGILSLAKFKNSPYDALLFLDDTGGGKDDNHDDLVIGVTVVPESSTIVLMMMGLLGLFAARRLKA